VVTWSAPGKVFLFGEHAVVYGKPAIALAIKPRVFVTVRKSRTPHPAKSPYIDSCFEEMGVKGSVYINSQLPSSSGLGSSAAVTVATLAAINEEFDINYSREQIAEMAFNIEKKVQKGRASLRRVGIYHGFSETTSATGKLPDGYREFHGISQYLKNGRDGRGPEEKKS
jgi:mevalonate kinase